MTDKEKAIVMAYTGITMLTGDKFDIFHHYIQEKLGRPIWTHEFAFKEIWEQIKEATKEDFKKLCRETTSDGEAIPIEWMYKWRIENNEQYNVGLSSFSQMISDWEKENAKIN